MEVNLRAEKRNKTRRTVYVFNELGQLTEHTEKWEEANKEGTFEAELKVAAIITELGKAGRFVARAGAWLIRTASKVFGRKVKTV